MPRWSVSYERECLGRGSMQVEADDYEEALLLCEEILMARKGLAVVALDAVYLEEPEPFVPPTPVVPKKGCCGL